LECYRAARAMRPQLGVAMAWVLEDARRGREGEDILRDLVKNQPNHPELIYYLGVALGNQKKWQGAGGFFQSPAELHPDSSRAQDSLGVALLEQKKWAAAEKACLRATEISPHSAKALFDLGLALVYQFKLEKAADAFRSAIEHRADWAEAYYNLGVALIR